MQMSKAEMARRMKLAMEGQSLVPPKMNRATMALFWEHRHSVRWKERGITPVFNLSKQDKNGTLSMYQLYMQCASDYEAALVILGSWDHWCKLCATKWFPPHLQKWQDERAVRLHYQAKEVLIRSALDGNISAAKYLYIHGVDVEPSSTPNQHAIHPAPSVDDDWLARSRELLDKED